MRPLVRLAIAVLMMAFGLVSYCSLSQPNQITGENQKVQLSPQQEVILGQRAKPEMVSQSGGLFPSTVLQEYVKQVGSKIVQQSAAKGAPYPYEFHLLRDPETINAFALPGGPVFITFGLFRRLKSESQLAGVLGHEIGHVVARHAAEHLAKQQLGSALVGAVGVAASDNYDSARQAQVIAQAVNQVVGLRYGRQDELESDRLGFRFMTETGYDPRGIIELMQILGASRSGGAPPEFFSSHPSPDNRIQLLQALLKEKYPNGVPPTLKSGREEFARVVSSLQR